MFFDFPPYFVAVLAGTCFHFETASSVSQNAPPYPPPVINFDPRLLALGVSCTPHLASSSLPASLDAKTKAGIAHTNHLFALVLRYVTFPQARAGMKSSAGGLLFSSLYDGCWSFKESRG